MSDIGLDHPPYYKGKDFEAIDIIEAFDLNFSKGNALKYILRHGKKCDSSLDLKKAAWYLKREIERIEKGHVKI